MTRKPRSHIGILVYRTWAFHQKSRASSTRREMRLACSLAACLRQDLTQTDSILPLSSDFERDCTRARASSGEAVTREKRGRCAVIFVSRAFRSRKERLLVVYISPLSRNSLGDATLLATRKPIII